jgi:hypothetical protein
MFVDELPVSIVPFIGSLAQNSNSKTYVSKYYFLLLLLHC